MLQAIKHSLLHLFYPQVCLGCGDDVLGTQQLCISCTYKLPVTGFETMAANPVEKLFYGRVAISKAAATFYFTQKSAIQRCLHELKYRGNQDIGKELGKLMGDKLLQSSRFNDIDVIIPLPLHKKKEQKRGYNQAAIICEGIHKAINIPVLANALIRVENTESQTKKSRIERWQNMQGKFNVTNSELVAGKHILVIDDVITTGATLEAAAAALLQVDGVKVSVATLCTAHQ